MDYLRGERLAEILARKYAGNLSDEERVLLEEWLKESDENVRILEDFMSGRSVERRMQEFGVADSKRVLGGVHSKIVREKAKRLYYRVSAVVAVFIAAVISGIYLIDPGHDPILATERDDAFNAILSFGHGDRVSLRNPDHATEWQEALANNVDTAVQDESIHLRVAVPRGSEYKLQLGDGTWVWLNSETVIEYPSRFTGDTRNVKLSGEAFFDVASDPHIPFVIETDDDMSVIVRGTRFNIQNYGDVGYAHVTLEEGIVEVDYMSECIILEPSQQAFLNKVTGELGVKYVADVNIYTAWTEGMFSFDSQSVGVILDAMSKWYDINIIYDNPGKMYAGKITFNANKSQDFSEILEMLSDLIGMNYNIREKDVYIRFE